MSNRRYKKVLIGVLGIGLTICMLAGCGRADRGAAIGVISREDGSGTRGAFTELLGIKVEGVDHTTLQAEISQSTAVVMATVAGYEHGIGYVSLGALNDSVKAIKVDGVAPTAENIQAGDYAVSRSFLVVTAGRINALTRDFITYIESAEGQAIVAEEGYIAVDDSAPPYEIRQGLSGRIVAAGSTSVAPVMQMLADAYKAINPDVTIEIQQTGSGAGITSTIEGVCDLGMSSRALTQEERAAGADSRTIAMDGIAVIVNRANPVTDLTSEQIRQIFTGEVTDWNDVQQVR